MSDTPDYDWDLQGYSEEQLYDHLKEVIEKAWERFQPEIGESVTRNGGSAEDFRFDAGEGRMNLLGARGFRKDDMTPCVSTNYTWDDTLFAIYVKDGVKHVDTYYLNTEQNIVDADSDPDGGKSYLLLGMHRYRLGKHNGSYRALNPFWTVKTIWDKDQDFTDNEGTGPQWIGSINIHKGGEKETPTGWSLGCQTVRYASEFTTFITRVEEDHSISGSLGNEHAAAPGSDGTRPVIYTLVEGHYLKPEGARSWTFPRDPVEPSAIDTHYANNEGGDGGFFPIGWNRLWHSGVHLWGEGEVKAVADGKIVAARMFPTDPDPVDGGRTSRCFVLVRHVLKLVGASGSEISPFVWSLYYHLAPSPLDGTSGIRWLDALTQGYDPEVGDGTYVRILTTEDDGGLNMRDGPNGNLVALPDGTTRIPQGALAEYRGSGSLESWAPVTYEGKEGYVYTLGGRAELADGSRYAAVGQLEAGEVVALSLNVAGGEVVGNVGQEDGRACLHFEVFTEELLDLSSFQGSEFERFTDPDDDPVADVQTLLDRLDTEGSGLTGFFMTDGKVTDEEAKAAAPQTRHIIVTHASEWAATNWSRLQEDPWFLDATAYQYAIEEVAKLQFWDGLGEGGPSGMRVVSYHPLTFIPTLQAEIDRQAT